MWALGLQAMGDTCRPPAGLGDFTAGSLWPEQVVGSKEEVQTYPCSGSPKLSSGAPASFQESPVGRQGAWYLSKLV